MMKLAFVLTGAVAAGMFLPILAAPIDSYAVSFHENGYRKIESHDGRSASLIFHRVKRESDTVVGSKAPGEIGGSPSWFLDPHAETVSVRTAFSTSGGTELDVSCPYLGVCDNNDSRMGALSLSGSQHLADTTVAFVDGYAMTNMKGSDPSSPFTVKGGSLEEVSMGTDSLAPFMEPERLALFGAILIGVAFLLRKRKRS